MRLAGIDINHGAVEVAKARLPRADVRQGYGFQLPYPADAFDCVTCIEVIEHVPQQYRRQLLSEIRRVTVPGGRLILRCPHAGVFSWLDAQNFRFRFPRLHKRLLRGGNRDAYYSRAEEEIVWHHHFTESELLDIIGDGWELETRRWGGLFVVPLVDIARWPLYRTNRHDHWLSRKMEHIAGLDYGIDYGRISYGILLVLRKR